MLGGVINALIYLVQILTTLVLVQFVLGLLIAFNVVTLQNRFVEAVWRALNALLEPILGPIRRIMPNTGGIDFSPMVLIIGLNVLIMILQPLAYA
ncbi:MAG: YggT family protein [Novosphingobium lindaniclasticum]|jgi:YggT family protein|uniref:YggT family protein n=1 Tax=Novosphingobium lindaniclasticum TaxID=1329895 RepID=UPI0024094A07|nr:YggT family protein [Novosphingobium lindaniclasticum]MDF2639267.1 YggT family protein [Novosphingobium lindaniclasticum]